MDDLVVPKDDKYSSRQYFYTVMAIYLKQLTKDVNGIGSNVRTQEEKFNDVRDNVKGDDIRNKTIIAIAVVVWTALGGGITMYIQKGMNAFENSTTKIDSLEKKIFILENKNEINKDMPTTLTVLSKKIDNMQAQIESLESKN